jgi:hypothetical protein
LTAARDIFAIGDKARFVVFIGEELAFPTAAFSIDEHRVTPESGPDGQKATFR